MKRSCIILCCSLMLTGIFWSCNVFTKDVMTALVHVQHYYAGRRAPDWNVTTVPSVWLNGQISGTKMPAFDYLQINDKQLNGKDIFSDQQGYVHVDSHTRIWEDSIAAPGFYPMTVTLATDIGELIGSVTIPDTLLTLSINVADTVPRGTPVTVSWTGGNADYYQVCYYHFREEAEWYWLGYSRDTVVTGNSVTFDSTYFTKNAELSYFEVYPVNGPVPVPGTPPNMIGDGAGYLYCENRGIFSDRVIVIGEYTSVFDFSKRAAKNTPSGSTPEARRESLRNLLGI